MTSKLTRDELNEVVSTYGKSHIAHRMAVELLAAMDREPVAWTWHYREQWHVTNDEERARDLAWDGVKIEPLYRHAQLVPVVADDLSIFEAAIEKCKTCDSIDEHAWNHGVLAVMAKYDACRATMLAAAPQSPGSDHATVPGKWIPVSERLPEDSGRYWCYVEEQNDLGKSHYQWNCSWNGDRWWVESEGGGIVTHWMPLPAAPQEVKGE